MLYRICPMLVAAALLTGCVADNEDAVDLGPTPTELAAYAATADYPENAEVKTAPTLTATLNPNGTLLTVRNFSNQPLYDAKVWVNQAYVGNLGTLSPNGSAQVPVSNLYNQAGRSLGQMSAGAINTIQLESRGDLFRVQGPQTE